MSHPLVQRLRRGARVLVLVAGFGALISGPARATWSIVLVNHNTGEIAVASATCIDGTLSQFVGILDVGKGAAAAQAFQSPYFIKRNLHDGIAAGRGPKYLMNKAIADPQSANKQYGIATFTGPAVTWHGINVCPGNPGRTGEVDGISYAIQGNILTGPPVVIEAERALLETPGDMSQRLMAAMQAARLQGGDGRCSCETSTFCSGNGCGAPPTGFDPDTDLSACIGFVFLARVGDEDAPCNFMTGCANGDYYMRLEHASNACDIDPMIPLQAQYADWRAAQQGRPDHIHTEVEARDEFLVGDGVTPARVTVQLKDIEGAPLTSGGHEFSLDVEGERPPRTELSEVIDNGDGTYTLLLTSAKPGMEALEIQCDDNVGAQVTFFPRLDVEILAPGSVTASASTAAGVSEGVLPAGWQRIDYTVHGGLGAAGQMFGVLAGQAETGGAGAVQRVVAMGYLDAEGQFNGALDVPSGTQPEWTVLRLGSGGELTVTQS